MMEKMRDSKSAQNKLVVLDDLPDSSVPDIGNIPSHHLFPIVGKLETEPEFYLHSDGSIFQTFRMHEFSMQEVGVMLENLPENSSLQFYRINKGESRFYFCIRIGIDYGHIDLSGKRFFSYFFGSHRIFGEENEKITRKRIEAGRKAIPSDSPGAGMTDNDVYNYLCDFEIDDNFPCTKYPVRSNISAILTGKSRHSCIFSINNLDSVPVCNEILKGHEFFEIATIVKPSKDQQAGIEKTIDLNREILAAICPEDSEKRDINVDTMRLDISKIVNDIASGVFFINVSFCLSEKSLPDLSKKFNEFEETLYKQGIVLYCHSNSARAQYISLFPGNSIYGEHWNKTYKKNCLMLLLKVMCL
ncbi:MAG: hypothetical protein GX556_17360 [Fibrobacter sp.]|nr:hypothetical protein [Fibrobacter sp.]